jgi:hypothetical protein
MKSLFLFLLLAGFATLTGCEDAAEPAPATSEVETHDGHDHDEHSDEEHDGHDHDDKEHESHD